MRLSCALSHAAVRFEHAAKLDDVAVRVAKVEGPSLAVFRWALNRGSGSADDVGGALKLRFVQCQRHVLQPKLPPVADCRRGPPLRGLE